MAKVYCNRTLNLKRINYIGFDMDHTLVRYNSHNFEALAHKIMLKKLVADSGYPESILNLEFVFDRAIRGLVIDKPLGNVLKLSRHAAIRVSLHGLSPIDFRLQKKLYKSTYIDLSDSKYDTVDTTFSIAFACLFMQLVELKETSEKNNLPDFLKIAEDLNAVLDRAHRDGSLKDEVRRNLSHYIIKDEEIVRGLERYKKHGKKLFVLTNSDFQYTKLLLDYAISPYLKNHKSWADLFDFVITSAQKPRFFYDKLKFLKIDLETGQMINVDSKITPGIYQSGCASVFTSDLNLNPDEILYIGDHIYGDVVRLKKDCAWRTALVVEELEHEVEMDKKAQPLVDKINALMDQKFPIEIKLDELISEKIETGTNKNEEQIAKLIQEINTVDQSISHLIKEQQKVFNPSWGEVMRVGNEESYFAYQVERFACVYMTRLADLLGLSPRTYFRSSRRPMAHEM